MNLNPTEVKVLAALTSVHGCVLAFRDVGRRVRLNRAEIRRACRSLARKSLAKFCFGCWTEDGEPYGSGYSATELGSQSADEKLVEKIVARMWD